jgi:hypothetical protein
MKFLIIEPFITNLIKFECILSNLPATMQNSIAAQSEETNKVLILNYFPFKFNTFIERGSI